MKKILYVFIMFLITCPVFSQENTGDVWFVPRDSYVLRGSNFTTEVHINLDNQRFDAYGFTITYDPSIVSLDWSFGEDGVEAAGFPPVAVNANAPGILEVSAFDPVGINNTGSDFHIITIHWIAENLGETFLTFTNLVINLNTPSKGITGYINVSNGVAEFPGQNEPFTTTDTMDSGDGSCLLLIKEAGVVEKNAITSGNYIIDPYPFRYRPPVGCMWLLPQNINRRDGCPFTTDVYANTGNKKLSEYTVNIDFNSEVVNVNTAIGTNGVQGELAGFDISVTVNTGNLEVFGNMETDPVPGGLALRILTIHWTPVNPGNTTLLFTGVILEDEGATGIGDPDDIKGINGTVTVTPEPDVNSDGEIDIIDALLVVQYYVGLNPAGFNPLVADVDCDGDIDIVDALLIAQYYVGIISSLCCT